MSNVIPFPGEPTPDSWKRPDEPDCDCGDKDRILLPCDWGWRCGECQRPMPNQQLLPTPPVTVPEPEGGDEG